MKVRSSHNQPVRTSSKLPINVQDLVRQRTVERDRIEYKAGWNPEDSGGYEAKRIAEGQL